MKPVRDAHEGSPDDTFRIDAVVLVEALVLDRDDRLLEVVRHLVERDRDAVRVGGDQLLELVALGVVDEGRVARGGDVDGGDVRRPVEDAFDHAEAERRTGDQEQQKRK